MLLGAVGGFLLDKMTFVFPKHKVTTPGLAVLDRNRALPGNWAWCGLLVLKHVLSVAAGWEAGQVASFLSSLLGICFR